MNKFANFAAAIMQKSPQMNTQRNAQLLAVLQSGDEKEGIKVAEQILQDNGITKEQAMNAPIMLKNGQQIGYRTFR